MNEFTLVLCSRLNCRTSGATSPRFLRCYSGGAISSQWLRLSSRWISSDRYGRRLSLMTDASRSLLRPSPRCNTHYLAGTRLPGTATLMPEKYTSFHLLSRIWPLRLLAAAWDYFLFEAVFCLILTRLAGCLFAQVWHVFSRDFTVLPAQCTPTRSSAIGMSHTCLCLPSYGWYSFTDPAGMEGWVDLSAK